MTLFKADTKSIFKAAQMIQSGELAAFPTETVYGLGADALNPAAVVKIFEAKNRPFFDPLIVHIADPKAVHKVSSAVSPLAEKLMKQFWPGPLTLVLPKTKEVPDIVTAGLPTVAVRMPRHEVALELIRQAGTPIAAPSANPFGYLSPTTAQHVFEQLGDRVEMILDGGACLTGVESTIVDLTGQVPRLLRPGGVPAEDLEAITGKLEFYTDSQKPLAPGQLPFHYAPKTPIRLVEGDVVEAVPKLKCGLLAFAKPLAAFAAKFQRVEVLSERGDLTEAAARLFSCLHHLDEAGLDMIYAQRVPEEGLGRAIMDRLRKAVAKRGPEQ